MLKQKIAELIEKAIKDNQKKGVFPDFAISGELVEKPEEENHGDYATGIALTLAKTVKKIPLETAEIIVKTVKESVPQSLFEKIEVAGPGFINFFLSEKYLQQQVAEIIKQKEKYGQSRIGKNQKVQVEFISANPTGPLTMGNSRGGFFGDVLANVLQKAGFRSEKAYYINDYGMQVMALGHSVLKDSEAVYKGDYIDDLNKKIKEKDPYRAGEKAAKMIIDGLIKKTVAKMGIKYDEWVSETWLHQSGRVEKAINLLKKKGFIYEKDDALWFRSSQFGDIRDRVLVKKNDWKTYLAGDAGLHLYKFSEKKFAKAINIWGADHYGDVAGLLAVVETLGYKGKLEIILLQFVTLIKNGKPFKMSKRLGTYITVDDLLAMVGPDAARFFILQRSADTHLDFNLDLAREQSGKNPVYYIQYAHARICSIIRKSKIQNVRLRRRFLRQRRTNPKSKITGQNLELLNHPSELLLIKQLIRFPEIVEETAKDYQLQRLPKYALDLATAFSQFYRDCRVINDDEKLSAARLTLALAVKIVLKNILELLGISAPEKM